METSQIRYSNFVSVFAKFKQENSDLPEHGMLKAFAETLGMSQAYLSHVYTKRKNIGTRTARNIEKGMKLPAGYMDSLPANRPISATAQEKAFIQSCLTMYRQDPLKAQSIVLGELDTLIKGKKRGKSK
jgi:hypothetical protein